MSNREDINWEQLEDDNQNTFGIKQYYSEIMGCWIEYEWNKDNRLIRMEKLKPHSERIYANILNRRSE